MFTERFVTVDPDEKLSTVTHTKSPAGIDAELMAKFVPPDPLNIVPVATTVPGVVADVACLTVMVVSPWPSVLRPFTSVTFIAFFSFL